MPLKPTTHRPGCTQSSAERMRLDDKARPSTAARGYDHNWRRLRKHYLPLHPLCVMCRERGEITRATIVDHIIPITEAPELRLVQANLRALCKTCHDKHTGKTQGFGRSAKIRGDGRS